MASDGELQAATISYKDYIGKSIYALPTPAAIIDRAILQRHCQSIRKAAEVLGLDFRFHVKTHKTREGTQIQAGHQSKDIRLIVSTVAELQFLLPTLRKFLANGRKVNVLYGMPLPLSQVARLSTAARQLGPGTVSVLVDHPSQLSGLRPFYEKSGFAAGVFLKVDTGYHRAGLPPSQINKGDLVTELMELDSNGVVDFLGLYSHSSNSYSGSTPEEAMTALEDEIRGCLAAINENATLFSPLKKSITISVGATPQVTSVKNLATSQPLPEPMKRVRDTIQGIKQTNVDGFNLRLELHAGVYAVMDHQQISTNARMGCGEYEDEIALSVMAEVVSVYNDGERARPEALLAVGVTALGREACPTYKGWGKLDRRHGSASAANGDPLTVQRISQESSIVSWESVEGCATMAPLPLEVGNVVRVYPNHACITGVMHDRYFVVDHHQGDGKVIDVWERTGKW